MKRLYKSEENKVISGVIGGLGEYMDLDATILRLAYIIITIATGVFPAIIGYFIAAIIVPKKAPIHHVHHTEKYNEKHEHRHEEENKENEPKTDTMGL